MYLWYYRVAKLDFESQTQCEVKMCVGSANVLKNCNRLSQNDDTTKQIYTAFTCYSNKQSYMHNFYSIYNIFFMYCRCCCYFCSTFIHSDLYECLCKKLTRKKKENENKYIELFIQPEYLLRFFFWCTLNGIFSIFHMQSADCG